MRVVVFGSNFGEEYLTGLRLDGRHEIAALVARGSERSKEVARRFAVDLVGSIDEIDGQVDLACLALPRKVSVDVARQCFARGTDVLVEHPIDHPRLDELLTLATAAGRALHVSVAWSRTPSVLEFLEACAELERREPALRIRASCASRLAYVLCDILLQAFPGRELVVMEAHTHELSTVTGDVPVQSCVGALGSIRTAIEVSYLQNVQDDGSDVLDGFEVSALFASGKLTLLGPRGPVVWSPSRVPPGKTQRAAPGGRSEADRPGVLGPMISVAEMPFALYRTLAAELGFLADRRAGGPVPAHQRAEHLRGVAQAWSALVATHPPTTPVDVHALLWPER